MLLAYSLMYCYVLPSGSVCARAFDTGGISHSSYLTSLEMHSMSDEQSRNKAIFGLLRFVRCSIAVIEHFYAIACVRYLHHCSMLSL